MPEAIVTRLQGAPSLRIVGRIIATALVVPPLMMLILPVVALMVTGPFMYVDARGMPVEPAWTGYVAMYGDMAAISAIAGALLGRVPGIRPSHALPAGLLTALSCVLQHYGKETLRGYPPQHLGDVLLGTLIVIVSIVPSMAFFLARGARPQ